MTYPLLKVEAINLAYSIDDTEQLSTRRGGGLLLLRATQFVELKFAGKLKPISTGASAGLFEVVNGDPKTIAEDVRSLLNRHWLYRHATFVVDVAHGTFKDAKEQILTGIRWKQMQMLSFSACGLDPSEEGVCEVDELRPIKAKIYVGRDIGTTPMKVSRSVQARHDYGRKLKQAFYRWQLQDVVPPGSHLLALDYTQHFDDLTKPLPDGIKPDVLESKMAVFYADGNKFSKFDKGAESSKELHAWDTYIKGERKCLLEKIVNRASECDYWKTPHTDPDKRKIRLEVLLWGGDELIFVVPGWCGMEFAQLFFEATKDMKYPRSEDGKSPAPGADDLTHACGIVFCHRQAPISGITKLAKKLADTVKLPSDETQVNALNWMVLESFDHAQYNLNELIAERYPHHTPGWNAIALTTGAVKCLDASLHKLKDYLPHTSIVRALRMMATGAAFDDDTQRLLQCSYDNVSKSIKATEQDLQKQWEELWAHLHPDGRRWSKTADDKPASEDDIQNGVFAAVKPLPSDLAAWIKLVELWDYCPALSGVTTGAGS